jgi:predicted lysophospholipase L1 biosynthesis ABC-type transport system permease subunit
MLQISVYSLVKEFHLPRTVASDILARERARAMRSHWQCWFAFVVELVVLVLVLALLRPHDSVWLIVGTGVIVQFINPLVVDRYAQLALRKAAQETAERLAGKYRSGHPWPTWRV